MRGDYPKRSGSGSGFEWVWVGILVPLLCVAILASQAPPVDAQGFTIEREVTPWGGELNEAQQLLDQAVTRLQACDISGAESTAKRIYDLGTRIRYDLGQAEQGAYVQQAATEIQNAAGALRRGGEYTTRPPITRGGVGIRLGPCPVSGKGATPVPTTPLGRAPGEGVTPIKGPEPVGSKIPAAAASGAIGALGYVLYATARGRATFGPRGRGRPGAPRRVVQRGPQYAPAPSPSLYFIHWQPAGGGEPLPGITTQPVGGAQPTQGIPPQPIGPGGQEIGGAGIQGPTPAPHPPVQNLQVTWPPGEVVLGWNAPPYDPSKERLMGYNVYRLENVPWSTTPEMVFLNQLPPGANGWQMPHVQTYNHSTGGDIEGYVVEPIYQSTSGQTEGQVYFGDGAAVRTVWR